MVDFASFRLQARDALIHLNDPPALRKHPLAAIVAEPSRGPSADALRVQLVATLDQLKPPTEAPARGVAWRRYRYLVLRYLEGASHEEIARELAVSTRQARRDHLGALETFASILWESYQSALTATARAASPEDDESPTESIPPQEDVLASEMARTDFESEGEEVDLAEVIRGTAAIAEQVVKPLGCHIDASCPTILPSTRINRTILRQIILALMTYAAESEPGGTVTLTASSSGDAVQLAIATRKPRHESRAGRSPNAPIKEETRAFLASGLQLAQLNGVHVRATQPPGETVGFHVEVPIARPRTLLVIDDNPDVARLFERYLGGTDFRIGHAKTWQRALPLVEETRPDAIILDVMIPSLDGWDILRTLKDGPATKDIPVIICSILPERTVAAALGADGFLAKPVTRASLLTALQNALRSRSGDSRGSP
jgi:CheY-like chemotaxis protein